MNELKVGDKAYFDSMAGLIPCKVLSITGPSGIASSRQQVQFRITTAKFERYGYKRGEVMSEWALHVVPRRNVSFRKYGARIRAYQVIGAAKG